MCWRWSVAANGRKDHAKTAGQKIACRWRLLGSSLKTTSLATRRKECAQIMANDIAFTGVRVAGMWRTLHAAVPAVAAIAATRTRRSATATTASVNRGTC